MTPTLVAHRGFAGAYPENTVEAARAAGEDGADLVEVDVRPSADGAVVVFHDDALDDREGSRGITDGTGLVSESTAAELSETDVFDSGRTVPTLADVLEALPAGVGVNVELKSNGESPTAAGEALPEAEVGARRAAWHPFVRDVLAVTDEFDGETLFSSFHEGAIAAVADIAPDESVAPVALELADGLEVARRYGAAAVQAPLALLADTPYADPDRVEGTDLVAAAHEEGLAVNVWTVRTWHEAAAAVSAGADGLIADYPCLGGPAAEH
ncbi:glycerophosphodiester phosphodiesterase [Candidatus Halobonum tyrrellensis]|uniref:Glycerophosphoryl diester phosphodiesterase n=1 Tax=Candidatus Halobonum tyrrellensis G22 TaxID=1324957 RepID=V4IY98_9EURY|nr:glycerophosphodiester phosphodiesterase [Candidatus Halobonum tyrrellensis]ESP88127.1 glycerophosphoryl diester phosphodiesterase [Candidatus Halobonum tyrrellensis G22]